MIFEMTWHVTHVLDRILAKKLKQLIEHSIIFTSQKVKRI